MRRLPLPAILLSILVLAPACSTPPDKERGQAEGAIAAAREASAEVYAVDDLRAAEAALARYDEAVAQKDYRQALNAALDARDRAYEAVRRASTAKADARARAEQLAQSLDTLATTVSQRLSGAGTPRVTGANAQRMKKAMAAGSTALQEARTAIDAGQYPAAITILEAAIPALEKEIEAVSRRGRS